MMGRSAMEGGPARAGAVRSVGVVGGGSAGYFAALALKKRFPDLAVTLIESPDIPIIGVGEATTTAMLPFLHQQLGLDVVEFYREVKPTWKLGIRFEWGLPGDYAFNFPFGGMDVVEAYAIEGDILNQSLLSRLMEADRVPIVRGDDGRPASLLPQSKFGYHLDNVRFVSYLAQQAARLGVEHLVGTIEQVQTTPGDAGVEALLLRDGRALRYDLYVDASGFSSLLLERSLRVPFIDYGSSVPCNAAVAARAPHDGVVRPYTEARTMDAGWCWRIPTEDDDHRGYVFSTAFLSADEAMAEMRAKVPGMHDPWLVRFRSGRHRDFWKGNTVAVGNSYGFVDPLESTALHMVIMEVNYVISALERADGGAPDPGESNALVGQHWDYLRWFLAAHFKYNRKLDTPFWRHCRESLDDSGLSAMLTRYREHGPWHLGEHPETTAGDPLLGNDGPMAILLGQRVPCPRPSASGVSPEQWRRRVAGFDALVDRALPQAEALTLMRERPHVLVEYATAPWSWAAQQHGIPSPEWTPPRDMPAPPPSPFDDLLRMVREPRVRATPPAVDLQLRLADLRDGLPRHGRRHGRHVRALWRRHFASAGAGHPYRLDVAVPAGSPGCPRCSDAGACAEHDREVDRALDRLQAELSFLDTARWGGAVVRERVRLAAAAPLRDEQVERLLSLLDGAVRRSPGAQRTFAFEPGSLRPASLDAVRRRGYDRLTLDASRRPADASPAGGLPDAARRLWREVCAAPFEAVHLALAWYAADGAFAARLVEALDAGPTSVVIRRRDPRDGALTPDEALALDGRFRALADDLGPESARRGPPYAWRLRPDTWILTRSTPGEASASDPALHAELDWVREPVDLVGVGPGAVSRIVGVTCFTGSSGAGGYDPRERAYVGFDPSPVADAALDAVCDLLADGAVRPLALGAGRGPGVSEALCGALDALARDGFVEPEGAAYRYRGRQRVYVDELNALLELARAPDAISGADPADGSVRLGVGGGEVSLTVERADPRTRYFCQVGDFGIAYAPDPRTPHDPRRVGQLMSDVAAEARRLLAAAPDLDEDALAAAVARRFAPP